MTSDLSLKTVAEAVGDTGTAAVPVLGTVLSSIKLALEVLLSPSVQDFLNRFVEHNLTPAELLKVAAQLERPSEPTPPPPASSTIITTVTTITPPETK